jgi:two-component sensor histidine kinase
MGRVNSMSVLYDKLLLTDDYSVTSLKEYLDNLIDEIISIFPGTTNVTVKKEIDDFQLDPKRLIPIGIIVNELLTNIMKYAFTGIDSGILKVTIKEDHGNVTLTIQDNGNGLPEGFDIDTQKGFGLMLVNMLSQQLDGNFSIENHEGTRSTVQFRI